MLGEWGIETQYISATVLPGDDFFTHANEGWIKQATLPEGMPKMDSFTEVFLRSESQIQAIVDDVLAGKGKRATGGVGCRDGR
jgi:endothelin-converting enzyme/putative endopeptidase